MVSSDPLVTVGCARWFRGTGGPRRGAGRHVAAPPALAGAAGEPWATMLIVHGLAEHCGRYEHVGRSWPRRGSTRTRFDLRGFGGSGGPRASIDRWSQLHDDLEERLVGVRSIAPSRPLVLFGHSLGGLISLGYVLDGRARPDLLVLSAPAIGAKIPLWQRALVSTLRRVAPGPTPLEPARREHAVERYGGLRGVPRGSAQPAQVDGSVRSRRVRRAAAGRRGAGSAGDPDAGHPRRRTGSCRPRRARPSRSPGRHATRLPGRPPRAPQRAGRARRSSATRSTGSAIRSATCTRQPRSSAPRGELREWPAEALGYHPGQLNTASGERRRAESVARPQTRGT